MTAEFLSKTILGNTVMDYAMAIAFLLGGVIVINGVKSLVLCSVRQWAKRSFFEVDPRLLNIFSKALVRLLYIGNISLAIGNLALHPILDETVSSLVVIAATVVAIQFISRLIEYSVRSYFLKKGDLELEQSFSALMPIIRTILWTIGAVFLLDNLGFDISAVIASLGIGGIAVAFAAQGVLGDLFSYFSLVIDRPFIIGDFIIVDDFLGTVEHIGIKTTRLKSISGEEIVIANTDLTDSRVRNFRQMERRRIQFSLGVLYETSKEKLEVIPAIIQDIIASQENAIFDRAHFASYGDFSLNFEIVYFVNGGDFSLYMDVQQKINLAIFEAFAKRDIEFAYPTNVTYLKSDTSKEEPIQVATQTTNNQDS
ncbi:mechanosensitive ion channel family protein [[Limnothrix rosea] IAM M-220]|uniref:mechanosensitive ion channel family protein n=1 Tax=[Limnothrix rosea] IAM M-220 TaxID=454133 RepID=UPI0009638FFC|nr:mechanosensitive ion channel family protein [[Limnothrix rosea] IAM M-220]OKH20002.1 mechanosensitive ion channel protein MscS [[Limnothrix rosea] IAM M-220]